MASHKTKIICFKKITELQQDLSQAHLGVKISRVVVEQLVQPVTYIFSATPYT